MPRSRKRHSRTSRNLHQRHHHDLSSAPTEECLELTGPEIHAQLDELRTAEDVAAFGAYVDAEAAGDPVLAAECFRRGLHIQGTPHLAHLAELIDLDDATPSWALARWASLQAYRWMLHEKDPRTDDAVLHTMAACYPDVDLDRPLGLSFTEFGTRIAASDWIARQLAVYGFGGLADFLDVKIGDGLLARCGPLPAWPESDLGGYRLRRGTDGFLDVRDLRDGTRRRVLDIGALADRRSGCTVLGRLVPIDVEPGVFFESRPLDVDEVTALGVARADGPEEWLPELTQGRLEGRLPLHFAGNRATPLTSDVVPEDGWARTCSHHDDEPPPAPAVAELQAQGLDPLRANNLGVCDVALLAVNVSPEAVGAVAAHVQAVLVDRRTFEAAKVHRTRPEDAPGWAALAGALPEPVRARCLELAALSRRHAA